MTTYKRHVLLNVMAELYPGSPVAFGNTYASIILYPLGTPLVSEQTIQDKYAIITLKWDLGTFKKERMGRLLATDMYGLADYPFSSAESKQAWLAYRQALRDITSLYPHPVTDDQDKLIGIEWPVAPVVV